MVDQRNIFILQYKPSRCADDLFDRRATYQVKQSVVEKMLVMEEPTEWNSGNTVLVSEDGINHARSYHSALNRPLNGHRCFHFSSTSL